MEAKTLKMRKGKIFNSKGDFHSTPLNEIQRNIRRGILQLWPSGHHIFKHQSSFYFQNFTFQQISIFVSNFHV